jgi:hypothetical protein
MATSLPPFVKMQLSSTSGRGVTMPVNLSKESNLTISIYKLNGRRVFHAAQKLFPAGASTIAISANALATGAYCVRLEAGGLPWSQKVVLR